ncbi:unnamed protein product [Heligmosomoides polygyrus]|uniref:SLC12 domain-containing protein n=1 Tax=Heligmosomoides polygyrus TaxID=6339 RepID=A0A183G8F0_HELPZ|nr:unnamed protein product [Heligmosomoides polygyrus]
MAVSVVDAELRRETKKKGVVDVWWLSDDGGLTLLVPYLLTMRKSNLEVAQIEIEKSVSVSSEEKRMASLLQTFRIQYTYLHVVPAFTDPEQKMKEQFYQSLEPFMGEGNGEAISEAELTKMQNKTARHIQTGSLVRNYSSKADLVVDLLKVIRSISVKGNPFFRTLPFPLQDVSSRLYLNWLETITRDLPCVLLIRGNHHNVLTFYS